MTTTRPLPEDEEKERDAKEFPELAAQDQDTGEILLPGTKEYAELVERLRSGEISSDEFVERIYRALKK